MFSKWKGLLSIILTFIILLITLPVVSEKLPHRKPGENPTVYLAGDSTVQSYDKDWKPRAGWGQMIPQYFSPEISFKNYAIRGRSSKSFIKEGRLKKIIKKIRPDDYLLIQFGHNDAKKHRKDLFTTIPEYKMYLKMYVEGARQQGATPILVTPVGKRDLSEDTGEFQVSFPKYVEAMREVAKEVDVPIVDLSVLSVNYYNEIGPKGTLAVFLYTKPGVYKAYPDGSQDNTHFQEYGAMEIARLLSRGIKELDLPLSSYVNY